MRKVEWKWERSSENGKGRVKMREVEWKTWLDVELNVPPPDRCQAPIWSPGATFSYHTLTNILNINVSFTFWRWRCAIDPGWSKKNKWWWQKLPGPKLQTWEWTFWKYEACWVPISVPSTKMFSFCAFRKQIIFPPCVVLLGHKDWHWLVLLVPLGANDNMAAD